MDTVTQLFPAFLLVLCRITSFFVVAPIFSTKTVPNVFKVGLGFMISVLVFLTVGFDKPIPMDGMFILAVIKEVLAGLLIGYVAYLFFTVIQTSGALMDMQMGFGIANIIDPLSGVSSPVIGNLKFMMMTLVFLSINGHHYLLSAIMNSYKWLPLDNNLFHTIYEGQLTQFITRTFADVFMLGLQIAAPIVVAMFLTDVGLGLLARAAPQYQVFVIGVPLKILIGLALLILLLPGFSTLFQIVFDRMFAVLEKLFVILKAT